MNDKINSPLNFIDIKNIGQTSFKNSGGEIRPSLAISKNLSEKANKIIGKNEANYLNTIKNADPAIILKDLNSTKPTSKNTDFKYVHKTNLESVMIEYKFGKEYSILVQNLNQIISNKNFSQNLQNYLFEAQNKVFGLINNSLLFPGVFFPWIGRNLFMLYLIAMQNIENNHKAYEILSKKLAQLEKSNNKGTDNSFLPETKLFQEGYLAKITSILPPTAKFALENLKQQLILVINGEAKSQSLIKNYKETLNIINNLKPGEKEESYIVLNTLVRLAKLSIINSNIKEKNLLNTFNDMEKVLANINFNRAEVNQNLWQIVFNYQINLSETFKKIFANLRQQNTPGLAKQMEKISNQVTINPVQLQYPEKPNFEVKRFDMLPQILYENVSVAPSVFINSSELATQRVDMLTQLNPHQNPAIAGVFIKSLCWHQDMLATGYDDGMLKLWLEENQKFKLATYLDGHTESINDIKIYKNYLISASDDSTIVVWDNGSNRYLNALRGHRDAVTSLYLGWVNLGQGSMEIVISGSADGSIKIWSFKSGNCLRTFESSSAPVTCLQLLGDLLIVGYKDQTIRIWDVAHASVVMTLKGHSGEITSLVAEEKHIISSSTDRTLRVWDIETGDCKQVLYEHHDVVTSLTQNSKYIFSAGKDKTIRQWDKTTLRSTRILKGHIGEITCLGLNEGRLLSGSKDQTLIMWDLAEGVFESFLNGSSTARDLYLEKQPKN